mgnify:CR=1 FL=1
MQIKIFTLPYNVVKEGFDDSEIQKFTQDKEILHISEYFFTTQNRPHLCLVIQYQAITMSASEGTSTKKAKDAWKQLLDKDDMALFETLRIWRNETSKKVGTPPYVICNNEQLATIAHSRPEDSAQLQQIQGIGENTVKDYGQMIIELIHGKQNKEIDSNASS